MQRVFYTRVLGNSRCFLLFRRWMTEYFSKSDSEKPFKTLNYLLMFLLKKTIVTFFFRVRFSNIKTVSLYLSKYSVSFGGKKNSYAYILTMKYFLSAFFKHISRSRVTCCTQRV